MGKKEDIERIAAELRTVDAKIEVVAQKIRTIEKNEEVIGRTLLNLSGRLKKVEAGGVGGASTRGAPSEEMDRKYATKSELAEVRYVIDSINPLEFATISQVRDLIEEKLAALSKDQKSGVKEKPKGGYNLMESI